MSKKTRPRFGVLTDWFQGYYQSELISGIEHEAKRNNIDVFYFVGRSINSPYPHEEGFNVVYDMALDASLDGLAILPMITNFSTDKQVSEFVSRYASLPLVTIGFTSTHGNAILTNNVNGFHSLVRHLTDDHGYRKLAFVNGPGKSPDAIERSGIYTSVLRSGGIPLDSSLITSGNFSTPSGREAVRTYIDERGLIPGRDMDVIVCANDQMAWGVLNELEDRGFNVPRDVAVTGFDDILYSIFEEPTITTVNPHVFEIGKTAVSLLQSYDPARKDTVFNAELVIRDSCGCGGGRTKYKGGTIAPRPETPARKPDTEKPIAPENIIGLTGQGREMVMRFVKTIFILDDLKRLKNTSELDEWLVRILPDFKIKSAFLFLYTDLPAPSDCVKLISGYGRKHRDKDVREKTLVLQSVFGDILVHDERRSSCILPLFYEDEQYGFIAVDVNNYASLVYDTLNGPIGSTIKNMRLMVEVKSVNEKLEETNRMLYKANEQKTQFFINVAHEMKTPLTLIQNYLERILARSNPDPELHIVKQNIDILIENMVNFLDAERLEKGRMSFSHDSFVDLCESVREKCILFRSIAAKKDITIELNTMNNIVVKIDPWALDRVLNNLIENAIKYTPPGGRVAVEVGRKAGKAVFRVSDNGPGLSKETIEHLFEPYYQLSRKRSSKQGIGVGLSIVKKILDDLGASIVVAKSKSGGASFTVDFIESKETPGEKGLSDIPLSEPAADIISPGDITEDEISGDKPSILIVDDNVQMLDFLKTSLKKTYDIFPALNAREALARLESMKPPELIISDVMMDGMDGHSFLAMLAGKDEYCDIPFIFLSAANERDEALHGLEGGAIDYIRKPFSIKELEKKIESIIALRDNIQKREIMKIRKGIDGMLSRIGGLKKRKSEKTFDSLCIKYGLSAREKEIASLLLEGFLNKEIAYRLHVSKRAVEYHITGIFKKVGVTRKYDLITKFNAQP
ncbi:MAG: substrate-binding domain-containing protein [Spirochaetales bacterium]|nr:substrate-binding domain-containing protein [Spirochaetales bacterium]